jgi:hypothetical protein
MSELKKTTFVYTEDLWEALEVLASFPDATTSDWYRRLEEAASLATQQLALQKGLMERQ